MGWFSNTRQRQVLRLEPSRGWNAVGSFIVMIIAGTISIGALFHLNNAWPGGTERPGLAGVPDDTLLIVAAVAGFFAVVAAAAGIYDFSRWRLSRMVIKASDSPRFRGVNPRHETVVAPRRAPNPPEVHVEFRKPGKFPRVPKPLHRVSIHTNVIGRTPMNIAYLRLFDNQPRARTFLESAWREFGYVFLLRSATSVTRREFTRARRLPSLDEMFVHDDEGFGATLRVAPTAPLGKGRLVLPDVAPTRVKVRDPYGSYPVRAVLCHGDYWKRAVDILLGQVHLVVLDLSGFTDRNAATTYELQRTVDTVPIEKVMVLCDRGSSRRLIAGAIHHAWAQMSADSPNATGGPRVVTVAVTDIYRRYRSQQGNQEVEQVRLEANRRQSRRVAAFGQFVAEQHRPVAQPAARSA